MNIQTRLSSLLTNFPIFRRLSRTANVLSEAGQVQSGDRVMVILPRLPEWWLLNIACLRTGTRLYLDAIQ